MPALIVSQVIIDWTRTDLAYRLPGGGSALRFDAHLFAAFDCFMLARKGAEADHPPDAVASGKAPPTRADVEGTPNFLTDKWRVPLLPLA